jgi:spherulation-specific family 4 protein
MPESSSSSPRRGRALWQLALLGTAALALAACSAASASHLPSGAPPGGQGAGDQSVAAPYCRQLVVPAYFYSSAVWAQAVGSKPAPRDIILDISGVGAGNAPQPHFAAVVRQAKARGVAVLGYISTVNGQRPVAQVETEVRNYTHWYGVTSIFLDRVSGLPPQAAYYRQLVRYIHRLSRGSSVWLNPGDFPNQDYMSIGDVVMVFEGTYSQYLSLHQPGWVRKYPASKFAHTIYATPGSGLRAVLKLATSRRAGHVYVTDDSGGNPYDTLPSYWSRETAAASAGCAAR